MRTIKFIQSSQMGMIDGLIRFVGRDIYIKVKNAQYLNQMITQLKNKGAKVIESKSWIKIDIFGDNQTAKLGEYIIDLEEDTNEQIEDKLCKFYAEQYKKGGFVVQEI